MDTCRDHDVRWGDDETPCWRSSYENALVEYVGVLDDEGRVLTTIWDYGQHHAGGRHRCDGSDAGMVRISLPDWILSWLN